MNRITVLLLIIISASLAANGQEFSVGFKPSFLILDAKYIQTPLVIDVELSSRYSFGFGITLQKKINKRFAAQIEPRYIAKGFNVDLGSEIYDLFKTNYISLPTLVYFNPFSKLNIELGFDFAYLISSITKEYPNGNFHEYSSSDQNHFELSLISGISYSPFKQVEVGVRYEIGLTPYEAGIVTANYDPYGTGQTSSIKYKTYNRFFELYLNVRLFSK